MQGLILQLTRAGFLLLLWLFVWAVLRTLRSDIYAASGIRIQPRAPRGSAVLPSFSRGQKGAKYLVVTQGSLAGTRITLGSQPVLIGRADDSTLVLTDDYASTRHARQWPPGARPGVVPAGGLAWVPLPAPHPARVFLAVAARGRGLEPAQVE
uniref:hypothetical protein n=1 Tax=Nocardia wallacei TaxID=480035 RepID=UPI0024539931